MFVVVFKQTNHTLASRKKTDEKPLVLRINTTAYSLRNVSVGGFEEMVTGT